MGSTQAKSLPKSLKTDLRESIRPEASKKDRFEAHPKRPRTSAEMKYMPLLRQNSLISTGLGNVAFVRTTTYRYTRLAD